MGESVSGPNGLVKKLSQIYETVDSVEKHGTNTKQNYKYVRATDMARAVRGALQKAGVYAQSVFTVLRTYEVPTFASLKGEGNAMQAVDVSCSVEFIDSETGERVFASGLGSGTDSGDKAVYKAQTGALKYALRNAFLIPDESDPEADEATDNATTAKPAVKTTPVVAKSAPQTAKAPSAPTVKHLTPPQATAQANEPPAASPVPAPISVPKPAAKTENIKASDATPTKSTTSTAQGEPPTKEQWDGTYLPRVRAVSAALQAAGMTPSPIAGTKKTMPVGAQLVAFILNKTGAPVINKVTVPQWDEILPAFEKQITDNPKILMSQIRDSQEAQS
jgi:hypothetical protein